MTFDALTMSAVRHELEATVLGGQVQRVVQTGPLGLGFELYASRRRWSLVCSAEPEAARVALARSRPVRETDTPSPLLLLLRKYVRDGRIVRIEQPSYERMLRLQVAKREAEDVHGEVALIIETMGRRSNVILVDRDDVVLEALRRVGPTRNPRRPLLPRRPYLPPPAQARLDPRDSSSYAQLAGEAGADTSLPDLLARRLAGFSPLAAREVAFRASGRVDLPSTKRPGRILGFGKRLFRGRGDTAPAAAAG